MVGIMTNFALYMNNDINVQLLLRSENQTRFIWRQYKYLCHFYFFFFHFELCWQGVEFFFSFLLENYSDDEKWLFIV